jgi:tRNA threonylcarbamoyladenosine biosynthesis protein TsaE
MPKTNNREETLNLAKEYLGEMRKNKGSDATVLLLEGNLGSGKTTFTQGLAQALHINDRVTSPTFIIEKIYKLEGDPDFDRLIHIDAYRLESSDEARHLGITELFNDPKNLVVLEWPEKIKEALPAFAKKITFTFISENEREITYHG